MPSVLQNISKIGVLLIRFVVHTSPHAVDLGFCSLDSAIHTISPLVLPQHVEAQHYRTQQRCTEKYQDASDRQDISRCILAAEEEGTRNVAGRKQD